MKLRWMAIAPALMSAAIIALAPQAQASGEQPGAPCSSTDTVSADGTLTCSHQATIWMHKGMPFVEPGQPCDRLGDVTYTHPENIVTCRPSGSGLAWEQ